MFISFPDGHEHSLRKTSLGCCGETVDEAPPKGSPCPNCGATSYSALTPGKLTIMLSHPTSLSKRKARVELTCDQQHWHDGNKPVFVERLIDRDHNLYKETVIDSETNEVIHRCEEPLSDHRDRGSARPDTNRLPHSNTSNKASKGQL